MTLKVKTPYFPPLCCYDPQAAPFGRYVLEMLFAEGLTGAEEHERAADAVGRQTLREAGGDCRAVR